MTLRKISCLCLLILSFLQGKTQTIHPAYIDGCFYVYSKDSIKLGDTGSLHSLISAYFPKIDLIDMKLPFKGLGNDTLDYCFKVKIKNFAMIPDIVSLLPLSKTVGFVERCPLYKTSYTPNDASSNQTDIFNKIRAFDAWNISKGSANVKVAILDNAILINHEDLAPNIWVNPGEVPNNGIDDDLNGYVDDVRGYDVADGDNNPNPPNNAPADFSHGTHCAGIAGAATDNGVGIASIGFNISLIPVKCSPNDGNGKNIGDFADGITYAINSGADVISMSFGSTGSSLAEQLAVNAAASRGIVLVAAAGNDNKNERNYPAAYSNVIAVGSTTGDDTKSTFSNYGNWVDIVAPGNSVYSCMANSTSAYAWLSGTSMSCPMVSAVAALLLSENSSLSPAQVEGYLKTGADNINSKNPSYNGLLGAGRLNAFRSLAQLKGINTSIGSPETIGLFFEPGAEKIVIRSEQPMGRILLLDMNGKILVSDATAGSEKTIELGNLAPGMYLLQAGSGNTSRQFKVIHTK